MTAPMPVRKKIPAWAALASLAAAALALSLLFLGPKKGEGPKAVDTGVEGVNLTYYDFDKNNQKKLEIRCRESQKRGEDELLMKGITATIFKADKLDKDIHITADAGTASGDFYTFFVHDNARIVSSDFSLASQSFLLKDRDILSSQEPVDFALKDIRGRAGQGLQYYLSQKTLKLFDCRGVMTRAGKPYDFRAKTLWSFQKKNLLVLRKDAEMSGSGATVRSDWISLQFDGDFANLQTASAVGKSYFQSSSDPGSGREQSREISANVIKMMYDAQGRLQRVQVQGSGEIVLADPGNRGRVTSEAIEISLNAETQTLETVRTLSKGALESKGRDTIRIKADSLLATYGKDGALARIQAEGSCEFSTDDLSGTAARLDYDAANFRVGVFGKDAGITSGKNTFHSSQFLIQTRLRRLSSDKGVKARLLPEKKNVLLRAKPVFITAAGMEMSEKGKVTGFKGKVNLFQDEIELHSGELLFDTRSNRIACRGGADLKFMSDNEPVVLHGQTMVFQAGDLKIAIEGDGRLKQAENLLAARKIELAFNRSDKLENISAADQVAFSKKDLSGKAQQLFWYFSKKTILFRNAAEITKKDAGTTRGQELRFNLDTNEIEVTSADDRSETIIRQEAP